MIDEKEAMSFILDWTKWGLNQLLSAWDQIFNVKIDENSVVEFVDSVVFGNLQNVFDSELDFASLADQFQIGRAHV